MQSFWILRQGAFVATDPCLMKSKLPADMANLLEAGAAGRNLLNSLPLGS